MMIQVRLDGDPMPNSMRYPPFIQDKRYVVNRTATGAVYQQSREVLVQGDGLLDWTAELLCFEELCDLYKLYKRTGPLLFEGQYGEKMMVEFVSMKPTAQGGGKYSIAGQFVVRCVLNDLCEGV
jgi:hypothetical protein